MSDSEPAIGRSPAPDDTIAFLRSQDLRISVRRIPALPMDRVRITMRK